jgi:PKD repeat protein
VLGRDSASFSWYVDGGAASATGPAFNYSPAFSEAGIHSIHVSVEGLMYTWTVNVKNFNQAPVVPDGRVLDAYVGDAVPLRATVYDRDGAITHYQWDINADGSVEFDSLTTPNTTWKFTAAGEYRAILRVTDNESATASTVYLIEVSAKPVQSPWWIPAVIVGILIVIVAVLLVGQSRKLGRLEDGKAKAAFYSKQHVDDDEPKFRGGGPLPGKADDGSITEPVPDITPTEPVTEAAPPEVAHAEEEPEVLQVKPYLGDKGASTEVHREDHDTEIKVAAPKKEDRKEPGKAPSPKKKSELDDIITTLLDKGADADAGASDLDVDHSISKKPRPEPARKEEPEASEAGLKDKKAESEVSSEESGGMPVMRKQKKGK